MPQNNVRLKILYLVIYIMCKNLEIFVFNNIKNGNPFNNCNSKTNGEYDLFTRIKQYINIIFDVGCRTDSEMLMFEGECHYFDPVKDFIDNLSSQKTKNKLSYFNPFGLGEEVNDLWYYPKYESFLDRTISCKISDDKNKLLLKIKKAEDYIVKHNIENIDFLKIDTEGFELSVLKGFGKYLQRVKLIQFEYGGTYLDNGIKLIEVKNYLESFGFTHFSYLVKNGTILITNFDDNYQYCNIICVNKNI